MESRPIETDELHRQALREIEAVWGAADGTAEGDRLNVLAMLIASYEDRRWPIEDRACRTKSELF